VIVRRRPHSSWGRQPLSIPPNLTLWNRGVPRDSPSPSGDGVWQPDDVGDKHRCLL